MSLVRNIFRRSAGHPKPAPEWAPDAQIEARLHGGGAWPRGFAPIPQALQDAYVLERATRRELIERLHAFGLVCLPCAVGGALLDRLREEFELIARQPGLLGASVDRADQSLNVRLSRESMNMQALPVIHAFFSSAWMNKLCAEYFGNEPYLFNYEIFVHETQATATPPSGALHLDKRHTLKFWVYPDDTPQACGPMRIVPGSHLRHRREREEYVNSGRPLAEFDNILTEAEGEAAPIVGPAGTVFVQDTDAGHGATPISPGHRRRIMRGHCRARRVHEWVAADGS